MTIRPTVLALASAALLGGAASAQTYDIESMQQGLSMVETNVSRILVDNGFEVDVSSLSLAQLVAIVQAADSDNNERSKIRAVLGES